MSAAVSCSSRSVRSFICHKYALSLAGRQAVVFARNQYVLACFQPRFITNTGTTGNFCFRPKNFIRVNPYSSVIKNLCRAAHLRSLFPRIKRLPRNSRSVWTAVASAPLLSAGSSPTFPDLRPPDSAAEDGALRNASRQRSVFIHPSAGLLRRTGLWLNQIHETARSLCPLAHRLPAHRRRAHGALQLALRPPHRRHVHPPH